MRDYERWHRRYDDPGSDLSWRLAVVRQRIGDALDARTGPVRILSLCAGDGRDVLGCLAGRADATRVDAVLVEINPAIAARAREAAAGVAARVEVREADAGLTDALHGAVPADVVLLVGILGNVTRADLLGTLDVAPALCAPGATLIWTRARAGGDLNDLVRGRLADAGFAELAYEGLDAGTWPAVGVVRYDGPSRALPAGARMFTFHR